jgi:hypothetical protein
MERTLPAWLRYVLGTSPAKIINVSNFHLPLELSLGCPIPM